MSENTQEKFLEVKDLEVIYSSDKKIVHAVNNVSFHLEKGKTLGLVGETGAGKTTIAKAIMRILPEPPSKVLGGSILMEGKDILNIPEKEMLNIRGKKAAMIFQDPMTALNPLMSVGSQIAEVIRNHDQRLSKKEAADKAAEMLELVGIAKRRYVEYPHQFSGGMKQRVVIAMALACNPELLLADEPTTALDVTIQAQVLELINDLKEKFNTSMILITHDLGVIAEMSDDVAIIYAGEIVEFGSKKDIFKSPQHPYTQGLFDSLPKLDSDDKRLNTIPGLPPDPTNLPKGCKFAPRCRYATAQCHNGNIDNQEVTRGHFVKCCHCQGKDNGQK